MGTAASVIVLFRKLTFQNGTVATYALAAFGTPEDAKAVASQEAQKYKALFNTAVVAPPAPGNDSVDVIMTTQELILELGIVKIEHSWASMEVSAMSNIIRPPGLQLVR